MVIVFLISPLLPQVGSVGFSTMGLLQGQFWTLVTSMFVHVDLLHLAVNMFFLYIFGNALEFEIRARKTLVVFFIAGVLTLVLGIPFYSPDTHIVGSSIAISALAGAALLIVKIDKPASPLVLYAPIGLVAIIYVIFNVFMLIFDRSGGVAWPSHIIGFVIGVNFGLMWRKRI